MMENLVVLNVVIRKESLTVLTDNSGNPSILNTNTQIHNHALVGLKISLQIDAKFNKRAFASNTVELIMWIILFTFKRKIVTLSCCLFSLCFSSFGHGWLFSTASFILLLEVLVIALFCGSLGDWSIVVNRSILLSIDC